MSSHTWDLWIPDAASRGVSFGRGVMEPAESVLVHSPPGRLRVEVRDDSGKLVAFGDQLERTRDSPMARLRLTDGRVTREDVWPEPSDLGGLVILPGGEVGRLREWWHAADQSEWRWSLEFYNHR